MRVLVTGASGLIGSHTVSQLVSAGHTVVAHVRSDSAAASVRALGAHEVVQCTLSEPDVLKAAASGVDAVVHTAFDHEALYKPDGFAGACALDRGVITALCEGLLASTSSTHSKPMVICSGLLGVDGVDEHSPKLKNPGMPRYLSDDLAISYATQSEGRLKPIFLGLAPVTHGPGKLHPFVAVQVEEAKKCGWVGYVEQGENVWQAVSAHDAAVLTVLALDSGNEKIPSGATLHVVQENLSTKQIAEFIAQKLGLPLRSVGREEAGQKWGFVGMVMGLGQKKTAALTKEWTGWEPRGMSLFEQLENNYDWPRTG